MDDETEIEWPREIWMREREEHDQGVVTAVLSEHATIARHEGDTEREAEFHHYIDADIYQSSVKYHQARIEALTAENKRLDKACCEWAEVSQANYQRAKAAEAKLASVGTLVFMNAEAKPKNVSVFCSAESVAAITAWYGAYFAGDRYTAAFNGRNVPMDINGECLSTLAELKGGEG
ncbi:hypothetical protein [Roseicyclus sp.]|uniref:hypothetical protein n=1 Tax=Roseicyclus sp. TaxID=1914329 RepID=UPI003F6D12F0